MKFVLVIFTLLFALISTQQVGKSRVLNGELGIELEKAEKSSHPDGEDFDNVPFLFLSIPSLLHFHGPKFFSKATYIVAPVVLRYHERFVHSDRSPPVIG